MMKHKIDRVCGQRLTPRTTLFALISVLALFAAPPVVTALGPTIPIAAKVIRPSTELPSAPPILTTYWAISATSTGLMASSRYHGGTSLVNRSLSEFFFATDSNHTITSIAVSQRDGTSFAALAAELIYFFNSNATSCAFVGAYATSTGMSFAMMNPTPTTPATPLVVGDTLYVGTQNVANAVNAAVHAVNISTAAFWWSATFASLKYANYQHYYSSVIRGGALMLQTSASGSSSITYFYSLDGVDQNASIVNSDSPNYQMLVLNSTTVMQVSFAMSFFLVPPFLSGSAMVADQTGKLGFSANLGCALFEVITAPFFLNGGYIYAVCLSNFYVVNIATLAFTSTTEPNGSVLAYGATFPDTSDTANKLFLGTAAGLVYRVLMGSAQATLTLVYTDPDKALWSGDATEIGMRYLVGFYPMMSSAQLVPNKAAPMLAVGVRVIDITSTLRAVNPLAIGQVVWQNVMSDFRLTFPPSCDGLHCVVASGTSSSGSSGTVPSVPLQLHTAAALVSSSNTTTPLVTVPPYFVWSLPSPTPLGVAFDYEAQRTYFAASDGLYYTTGGYSPTSTKLCAASTTSASLVVPPTWVYDYITQYRNVTFNVTTPYNVTTNVTMHNATSNTNYTVLVNTTLSNTTVQWKWEAYINATKSLCYVDQSSKISCYNTTTGGSSCAAVSQVQLCDGSSALASNRLVPVGGIGSGTVAMFCTGATATIGVHVLDVRYNIVKAFGSRSTSGALGAVDDVDGAIYVPEEQTGAQASADPATKRYAIRKFWANATSGGSSVWRSALNVSIASNIAVDPVPGNTTTAVPRSVRVLGTVLPTNNIRGYQLASFSVATGDSTNGNTQSFPVVQFDGSVETYFAISSRWINATNASATASLQAYTYVLATSFFAVVNATATGRSAPIVLWVPTTSFGRDVGLFNVRRAPPIMDHNLGVGVVVGTAGVTAFSLRNGTFLWQSGSNSSFPSSPTTATFLLTQINSTVVFTTQQGVAAVDLLSGTRTFDLAYQAPAVAVGFNGTSARYAAVCGISTGTIESYTKNYFVAIAFTSEGLFAAPFFVQPNLTLAMSPLQCAGTQAFRPIPRRTETITPVASDTISWTITQSMSREQSMSRSLSEDVSLTRSDPQTLTVNPLESRTRRHTHSYILSLTNSTSASSSDELTKSLSKPKRIPTHTRSTQSSTMSRNSNSMAQSKSVTQSPSKSRGSQSFSSQQSKTRTAIVTITRTTLLTLTPAQVSWSAPLTRTKTAQLTETPIYIPPPTPPPTPAPTPVPPNLAAPPEEANYAFIVGPSVAFVVIAVALTLAILAKRRRSAKKAEAARNRLERGDVTEEMHTSDREMGDRGRGRNGDDDYEPPMLEELDARE